MERNIEIAKSVLSSMFGISEIHFERHTSRASKVNEARRFLVYYLVRECGIKYAYIKDYVPSLTNHATAIHHVKRMNELMDIYPAVREKYEGFKVKMETEGQTHLVRDYQKAIREMEIIKLKINTLKKLV